MALSSCETEYISTLLCACQAMWLKNLLKELGSEEGDVVILMVDNIYTINLAKNPIANGRSKHIKIKFHYLRELISEWRLRLGYCTSEDQVVDLLTKDVSIEMFKRLKKHISMKDSYDLNYDCMFRKV